MNMQRPMMVARWTLAFAALIGIVLVYRLWLHVNATTVALSLLMLILVLAAEWGLRYAVAVSIAATACYNFFFLPPLGTFTISDPQNWITLFTFLATSMIASRLSQRARDEASDARARQRELEVLLRLSREMLLQSESVATLLSVIPAAVASVTSARSGVLYLLEGDRVFRVGEDCASDIEIPHLRQLAMSLQGIREDGDEIEMPIHSGVKPRGLLLLRGAMLSARTAEAIGSLVSISLDRAQALESIARDRAAKEAERLRSLVIDSITHELRTPLTSIKGAATSLIGRQVAAEEQQELLAIIDEECDRLNRLVAEAVEMAQLDARQVKMHPQVVAVRELVENARAACAWVEDTHVLNVDVPGGLAVRADPGMLSKVIVNLLENAAKYSAAGTPIWISAEAKDGRVSISVADRGIGIDASEQELIFERFYRARAVEGDVSGTGMGLAIGRAIAQAHGGEISVTSQVGKGSVFMLTLPA